MGTFVNHCIASSQASIYFLNPRHTNGIYSYLSFSFWTHAQYIKPGAFANAKKLLPAKIPGIVKAKTSIVPVEVAANQTVNPIEIQAKISDIINEYFNDLRASCIRSSLLISVTSS
jgi:hypothetical protein